MNTGEAIFELAEGDENLLAVLGDGLLISGLGPFVVRPIAATGKDGQGDARTDGPDTAFPIEEIIDIGADKAARSEEHTSELQSLTKLVCRLFLEKKK